MTPDTCAHSWAERWRIVTVADWEMCGHHDPPNIYRERFGVRVCSGCGRVEVMMGTDQRTGDKARWTEASDAVAECPSPRSFAEVHGT